MSEHLISELERFTGHHVLCIGDIMLDRFVYGKVERISPEAPIPVLRIQRETVTLGGCGNVVRNLVSLGGHVDIIGVIGHDQAGYCLVEQFSAMHQVVSYVITDNTRPTTIKTRYIDGGHQLLRADDEVNAPISEQVEEQIMMSVRSAIDNCDVIILSDYAKGVLTDNIVKQVIKLANEKNKTIMIDPKGRDFTRYRDANILTPNRKELAEATGLPVTNIDEAETAARKLISENNLSGVLAKLGGDGICLVVKDEPLHHYRHNAREIYDVSGAGDTVVAMAALALASGLNLQDAAELANISGSIVVGKVGTATVCIDDIVKELHEEQAFAYEKKMMTWERAVEEAERWRKQGLKIGFTNGVFDLLNLGHLSLIRQTKGRCDRLIVALNMDASAKRVKGEGRPIYNEITRATLIASLADVDGVILFSEDTPYELIKKIRPNVISKGANYTVDKVVGSDIVQDWGGKVFLTPIVDGHSTTSTITKLRG